MTTNGLIEAKEPQSDHKCDVKDNNKIQDNQKQTQKDKKWYWKKDHKVTHNTWIHMI